MCADYQLSCLQTRTFATQLTMAVNKFVWILKIPTSASVMKNSYWRKMERHVDVSSLSYKSMFLFEAFKCCGCECTHVCLWFPTIWAGLKKILSLPNKPHLTNPIHFSQIRMFATQSTTAVSIFVLILVIPMSASVMKTSYWGKMEELAGVSYLILFCTSWSVNETHYATVVCRLCLYYRISLMWDPS